ncbi:hypothetical protein [Clavibacter michiganensis]|uniref:hypothetical protein n=2 Tax=Clavibacter michiganensis TaxID=28447 RepID=UPI00117CD45C|nr:hypothetical protein [Clavibacter michiganensis]
MTALMPGVRQLRTPLAAGALWLGVIYLAIRPQRDDLVIAFPLLRALASDLNSFESIYTLGALAFIAYLVGSMTQGASSWLAGRVTRLLALLEYRIRYSDAKVLRRWRQLIYKRQEKYGVRPVIMDAVSQKYSSAGFSSSAYLAFPFELIEAQLEPMSLQIWHKAADQYQESDRLRGESDFRVGVALPIIVLAIQLSILFTWWVGVLMCVGALVLIAQSRNYQLERRALLANAFYQGLADSATLDGTVRALKGMTLPAPMSLVLWYEATAIALSKAGSIEGFEIALNQGAEEACEEVVFGAPDWKLQIDDFLARVRPIFENHDNAEDWQFFELKVGGRQAAAETALESYARDGGSDAEQADRIGRMAWRRA